MVITYRIVLFILFSFFFSACKAQPPALAPTDSLPAWLSEKIIRFTADAPGGKGKVEAYEYHRQTVYLVDFCIGCPDHLVYVYNVQGEEICRFGGITGSNTCPDFDRQAELIATVWPK